jgi:aspartate/methionine/tyrosine aminotransferase
MPRSAIRQVMALAKGLGEVVHFEVGEPCELADPRIVDAAFKEVRGGATKYVANAGDMELRQLIADRTSRRLRRLIPAERVIVTTGAVGALFTALSAILEPGSELLVPDPGWPNYYSIAAMAGARCVPYRLHSDLGFQPNLTELADLVTPATRAILVNSPGNPTGAVFSADTVKGMAEIARQSGLHIVSDEIYQDIVFDGRVTSFGTTNLDDQTWIISGVSKSFAMTGWRIGWLVAPEYAVDAAVALQEPVVSCVAAPSQAAAIAALRDCGDVPPALCAAYAARRDLLVMELSETGLLASNPQGGYYAMLDIAKFGLSSFDAAVELLKEQRVALVPGGAFGPDSDRYLRLAFTTSDQTLRDGCARIRRWASARAGGASS